MDHLSAEAKPRSEIRILSYNVRSLRDDTDALARVITACRPDVVCVQESPRFFGWRKAARRLADSVAMTVICGGADASGNLLLGSRQTKIEHAETLYLKHRRGLHLRGMAIAVVGVESARLTVASTHLSLDAGQRLEQAREVLGHLERVAAEYQTPSTVLAGDFNSHPGSPEWGVLAERHLDAWAVAPVGEEFSSTADNPFQRIDAVFVSPDLDVVGAGVPVHVASRADMVIASDHRPVLAVLHTTQ